LDVDINDSVSAASSAQSALRAIDGYFLEHETVKGARAIIPVRVELGGLIIEHLVSASITSSGECDELNDLNLEWIPKHDALYPAFRGTLHVSDHGAGSCRIEIRGSYTPPLGRPGAVLDAMLGRRVAHATLLELLGRFRFRAEAAYR